MGSPVEQEKKEREGPFGRVTEGLANVIAYHLRLSQEASFAAYARRVGDAHIAP